MKHLLLLLCTYCVAIQKPVAQTFRYPGIFIFWNDSATLHDKVLKKNGFKEVYGGPKKGGGSIYLYHNKTAQEYLFINYTKAGAASFINYYVPTKAKYKNLLVNSKKLSAGETIRPQGLTEYDGKKYYQVIFSMAEGTNP